MATFIAYLVWRVILIAALAAVLLLAYRRYGDTVQHRQNVTQFGGGVLVVVCLYYASLFVMHQDQLVQDSSVNVQVPQRTMILAGFIEVPVIANTVFETLDPRAPSFVALPRSYNRQGGAQFTYQFWLFLDAVQSASIQDTTILLRGDPRHYKFNDWDGTAWDGPAIQCPSISIGDTFDEILVRFNTLEHIMTSYNTNSLKTPGVTIDPVVRRNLLLLMSSKWVLFTVVFEDNTPISEFEDGIMLRFYVNDVLYDHQAYPGQTLRQNNGQLILFPGADLSGMNKARIADVSYYNYALDADGVAQVFAAGAPTYRASVLGANEGLGEPLYLSEYNKLGMYTA